MKIRVTDHFIELTPDKGKQLINKELTELYDYEVYLSALDSVDNYTEINRSEETIDTYIIEE